MTDAGSRLLEELIETVKQTETFPFDLRHLSEQEVLTFLECGQSILDVHKGEDFRLQVLNARVDDCYYR